jgi:uncharacterized protein
MRQIRIAAAGDIHCNELTCEHIEASFARHEGDVDLFLLAGDLTTHGEPDQAQVLVDAVRGVETPVVAVLGNHDYECGCQGEVSTILKTAGVRLLDGQAIDIDGVGFVGVKGFIGGFGRRMLGSFGEPTIKAMVAESMNEAMRLENAMRQVRSERAVVVLHYAPIAETVEGEPLEIFPFLGSSRLAETIDRFKVSAVLHGHAHRGAYEGRTPGGAPVYNVARQSEKPTGRPYALLEI